MSYAVVDEIISWYGLRWINVYYDAGVQNLQNVLHSKLGGICQRKDGKYSARYIARDGSRREKHFDTLPEARSWLADSQYEAKYNKIMAATDITVDSRFDY